MAEPNVYWFSGGITEPPNNNYLAQLMRADRFKHFLDRGWLWLCSAYAILNDSREVSVSSSSPQGSWDMAPSKYIHSVLPNETESEPINPDPNRPPSH